MINEKKKARSNEKEEVEELNPGFVKMTTLPICYINDKTGHM